MIPAWHDSETRNTPRPQRDRHGIPSTPNNASVQ